VASLKYEWIFMNPVRSPVDGERIFQNGISECFSQGGIIKFKVYPR